MHVTHNVSYKRMLKMSRHHLQVQFTKKMHIIIIKTDKNSEKEMMQFAE